MFNMNKYFWNIYIKTHHQKFEMAECLHLCSFWQWCIENLFKPDFSLLRYYRDQMLTDIETCAVACEGTAGAQQWAGFRHKAQPPPTVILSRFPGSSFCISSKQKNPLPDLYWRAGILPESHPWAYTNDLYAMSIKRTLRKSYLY